MSTTATNEKEVVITRTFDAPREAVFRAWTDPAQLVRWYAPIGCRIEYRHLDVRMGGTFHSCIHTPDGHACWCIGTYREVAPPSRLVLTMAIADEAGNARGPIEMGMDPEWPAETVITVTFEEKNGKTTLTLHQTVCETLAMRTGAHPSWLQMLDRLGDLLESTQ